MLTVRLASFVSVLCNGWLEQRFKIEINHTVLILVFGLKPIFLKRSRFIVLIFIHLKGNQFYTSSSVYRCWGALRIWKGIFGILWLSREMKPESSLKMGVGGGGLAWGYISRHQGNTTEFPNKLGGWVECGSCSRQGLKRRENTINAFWNKNYHPAAVCLCTPVKFPSMSVRTHIIYV